MNIDAVLKELEIHDNYKRKCYDMLVKECRDVSEFTEKQVDEYFNLLCKLNIKKLIYSNEIDLISSYIMDQIVDDNLQNECNSHSYQDFVEQLKKHDSEFDSEFELKKLFLQNMATDIYYYID